MNEMLNKPFAKHGGFGLFYFNRLRTNPQPASQTPSSAEAADPFVRFADISPNMGISLGKGAFFVKTVTGLAAGRL